MLAAELMIVIYASFSLRRRIGVRNWRRLHYLTFGVFGAATVHGLTAGTDRWAFPLYAGSIAAVIGLTVWRVLTTGGTTPGHRIEVDRSLFSGMASCVKIAPTRSTSTRRVGRALRHRG